MLLLEESKEWVEFEGVAQRRQKSIGCADDMTNPPLAVRIISKETVMVSASERVHVQIAADYAWY